MSRDLELTDDEASDFGLFDTGNPRSLVSIVPDEVRKAILRLPDELRYADERSLRRKASPTPTLNYLRLNFWLEYNRAQERQCDMSMSRVIKGVTHKDFLYRLVLQTDTMVAWMICPPADYAIVQQDILHTGLDKLRQCVSVKPYKVVRKEKTDKDGNVTITTSRVVDTNAIKEIREIVRMLSDRVQGTLVQRLAIKQHTLNDSRQLPAAQAEAYGPDDLDRMTKSIQSLERSLLQLEEAPDTVTVETEVIDAEGYSEEGDA